MSMSRRLTFAIGAALLVGGWGAMQTEVVKGIIMETGLNSGKVSIVVAIVMAVGAGLIGFAVLRPAERNDD